ncbi:YccF domain-containing protein [Corynebacterium aquatimens]|uniref:YccF domain-containing protein n=1 Tax=Corynebacterium TaxID=1716 RepID=UPI001F208715|nr:MULTISPECIES: YccF domain-containing protein [Corynebacterium]QYH19280.1 YccF domain-containing protein [Corynebacterium aquatimens]UIZ91823.1 YccF domain-containing protein [Corynebacterium sp. CNCTC7651]
MGLIRFILNIIWLFTAGIWLFIAYTLAGIISCLLIVTIPFGIASFRIAGYVIWPFGREVVQGNTGAFGMLGNILWFVFAGMWLSIGHVVTAGVQAITIIGLPLAWANLKMIPVMCFPFGSRIVSSSDDRARYAPVVR